MDHMVNFSRSTYLIICSSPIPSPASSSYDNQVSEVSFFTYSLLPAVKDLQCLDWKGQPVSDGFKYIPKKEDPCMACVCDDGFPIMCTAVLCSPPECHMWEPVDGECCRFNCIEPDHPTKNRSDLIPRNTKTSKVYFLAFIPRILYLYFDPCFIHLNNCNSYF